MISARTRWNPTVVVDPNAVRSSDEALILDVRERIATITVNRAHKGNSLNLAAFRTLHGIVSELQSNPDVGAVIVTGAGERAFSAGADITELDGLGFETGLEYSAAGQHVFDRLEALPKPVIAAVNGVALGGGLELALACDIRVAADTAGFAQPEITLANVPGWGATQRLPRVIGVGRAMDLLLSGRRIDAATAIAYGLVSEVVPATDLAARARELATQLAGRPTAAVAMIKNAVHTGLDGGREAGLKAERTGVATCSGRPEQLAAVHAFLHR